MTRCGRMIEAEFRLLEDRRELARAQNMSTALAVVAMAGAVYAGSATPTATISSIPAPCTMMAMLGSIWAMNSAFSKNAESKTVGENFLVQMAPAINRQVMVQVEWLQSREDITARDFSEFRNKTLALYQSSVRSASSHTFDPGLPVQAPGVGTERTVVRTCAWMAWVFPAAMD